MPNTMYTRCELRDYQTNAAKANWNPGSGVYSYYVYATPKPMSRKKARKAYTAAEEDFYTAKAAVEQAEREVREQRAAMEAACERMDEAARILAVE